VLYFVVLIIILHTTKYNTKR